MPAFLLAALLLLFSSLPLSAAVISGFVRDLDGAGIASVQVNLSGAFSQVTVTDGAGAYSFSGIALGGNYTVTPSKSGIVFTPLTRTYTALPSDQSNQDFTFGKVWSGAGGNARASNAANWVGGVAPLSGDLVRFESTGSTIGCFWDITTVVDTFQFKAAYSSSVVAGVDIIARNVEIAGGEFLMGSKEIRISRHFTHTGGRFRATTGGTALFDGTALQLISMVVTPLGGGLYDSYFNGFRVNTSSTVRLSSDVIADGTFNISSGRFDVQRSTLTLTGGTQNGGGGSFIWDDSGGTLLPGSGGIAFDSAAGGSYQLRQATLNSFNNLMVAGNSSLSVVTAIKTNRTLTIRQSDANPSLNLGDGYFHTFSGTVTVGPVALPSSSALTIGASTAVFQVGIVVGTATVDMQSGELQVRAGMMSVESQGTLKVGSGETGQFVFSNNTALQINSGSLEIDGSSVFTSSAPAAARFGVLANGSIDIEAPCEFNSLNRTGVWIRESAQPVNMNGMVFRNGPVGGAALNFDPIPVASITVGTPTFDATISTNVRGIVDSLVQPAPNVYIVLATGAHIGPAYEYDPSSVIHWGMLGVPTGVGGTALGISSITWSWTSVNFPLSFYVVSSTGGIMSPALSADARSWVETGLSPNISYTRLIRAVTDTDQADSSSVSVYTKAAVPGGLAFTGIFITSVTFSWTLNGNPTDTLFEIDRSTDNVTYVQLQRDTQGVLSPYIDTGLIPETTYYYRVFAENGSSQSSGNVVIATHTAPVPPPRVFSVLPSSPSNLGVITLVISGAHIQSGAQVRLKRTGSTTLTLQNVSVPNDQTIQGTVRLTGITAGAWDIEIENPDGKISINSGLGSLTIINATSSGNITVGDYSASSTLTLPTIDGRTLLSISSGALSNARVYVSVDPESTPLSVSPSLITSATEALDNWIFIPGSVREILAFTQQGLYSAGFNKPVSLGISFPDADHDGIIDVVTVRRVTLRMMTLNENTGSWELLPTHAIDIVNNRVTASLSHFSVYALFGSPAAADLSEAKVYPSPWKPGSGGAFDSDHLTFSELTESGEIRVYSAAAKFVKSIPYDASQAGITSWDGRDESGQLLPSGMYLIHIKSSVGDIVKLKLGVER